MDWLATRCQTSGRRYRPIFTALVVLTLLALAGSAIAAEVASDEVYHLREGEVISDDLTVAGREIIIDGTVEGDLVATGASVIVNGIVTGDLIAAGAEVQINGVVQDDVRAAGAAIQLRGKVGDDLFVAGGSFFPGIGSIPINVGGRTVISGISTEPSASVGGDAYVVGGQGSLEGLFRGDLFAGMNTLVFNAEVEGDAALHAEKITFGESAYVAGDLEYSTGTAAGAPKAGGAVTEKDRQVEQQAASQRERRPVVGFGWWLMRTLLMVIGTVLVALVVLQLFPGALTQPADAIEEKPVESGLYGVLVAVALLPLSAALAFLAALFFGWFWGGVSSAAFTFGFFTLAWVLSPVVAGLWLGRRLLALIDFQRGDLYAVLVGVTIVVLTGRVLGAIPCAGIVAYWIVYLLSFALTAGGILMALLNKQRPSEA